MLRRRPIMSAMAYVPLRMAGDVAALKRALTVSITPLEGGGLEDVYVDAVERDEETTIDVPTYDLSKPGYIGVPRAYGIQQFAHLKFVDRLVRGKPTERFNVIKITPRDQQQREFWNELANVCTGPVPCDFIANAGTGSGKTAGTLWLASRLKKPILVLVHTNKLKRQWLGNTEKKHGIEFFYGKKFMQHVGVAQQDVCDYEGKAIVVGMLPSIARRRYPPGFYRHFGLVMIDEVHKAATPTLAEALKKFPAAIRGGLTATNRSDALRKVTDLHLGKPKIKSAQETLRPIVYRLKFTGTYPLNQYSEHSMITSLSEIDARNEFLADLLFKRGVQRGRKFVGLSDRTKQLQAIRDKLIARGVNPKLIALHVGEYYTGKFKVMHNRKTAGKFDSRSKAHYFIRKNMLVGARVVEEKIKVPPDELERMTVRCRYILASYGIFDTGVDVPDLDQGYELTPRGNVKQAIGRTVRQFPGKPTPEWYSVDDLIKLPGTGEFVDPEKQYVGYFRDKSRARETSFLFHKATVKRVKSHAN